MLSQMRVRAAALVFLTAAGCGVSDLTMQPGSSGDPFIAVSRGALTGSSDASTDLVGNSDHFYVAISKAELGKKWFLSGYLTQWHPSSNTPMQSLGTRVVTFAVQNGKLFVFDATDGKAWSDVLDPTVVVEAYPIVTDFAPFNALPSASQYVLFDPAAGLSRFDVVGDTFAQYYWARFEVDLMYLQRFRSLADGASWEQVFTGYTEVPGPGVLAYEQPFRGSGTLAVSLRRYSESPGFTPTELGANQRYYFPSQNWQLVKNEAAYKRYTSRWNVKPGMTPIPWKISAQLQQLQADPRYQGVDVASAITRGVEDWNAAFGFPVFQVVPAQPGDSPGDDDQNFVVVDRNPGAGLAFANWRENPNTKEIRGASVYFSAVFIQGALEDSADAGTLAPIDAGAPATIPCSPNVVVSQVYGGSSATAAANQDFVELHNRTASAVSLSGWSLQYASAAGTSWQVVPLDGTIAPGGFYLVGLAATADGGVPLSAAPDQTAGVNLSATAGKVALVASTTALSGSCPAPGAAIDFVGYGSASCAEASPIAGASASASVARRDACADTDSNAMDFVSQPVAPKSSQSAAQACTCVAPAAPPPGPSGSANAGVFSMPAARPVARTLSWQAMPVGSVCGLHGGSSVEIPAGLTRREYVERVIEHTIAHEIGHTLGLRHNFKGSIGGASVMDYVIDSESALAPKPGAYDVAAVRYLYGLDASPPAQPFCTDEDRMSSASCDIWDTGANPLTQDIAPRWQARVRGVMAGTVTDLQYAHLHRVTRYVRGPESEAQRLEAFNALIGDVAPPIQPSITALGPNANAYADLIAAVALSNLFLDPVDYRDELQVNPYLADAAFRTRVIAVAKGMVVNSDKIRSWEARRSAIDVLKAMQTYDAFQALVESKPALATERAGYNAIGQSLVDDLTRRIDVACTPYFVH